MAEPASSLEHFTFPPPLPPSSSPHDATSPSSERVQVRQSHPSDLHFDQSALARSPEHPAEIGTPWGAASVDSGFGHNFNQMSLGHDGSSPSDQHVKHPTGGTDTLVSPFNPMLEYAQPTQFQPHMLNHAWSNSSLASLASQPNTNTGLLVQTYPHDNSLDMAPHSHHHSRSSSYSSLSGFEDKFSGNQMPVMDMYPLQGVQGVDNAHQSVATGDLFMTSDMRHHPKLAVQTQGLGKVVTARERSASRSMPYQRHRSESLSLKSEEGDDIGSLISASTTYSASHTPWSTTSQSIAGGLNKLTLHHRRTSSNTTTYTPVRTSPTSRPMLSRARRSSSMILPRQQSQPDLRGTDLKLHGSAAERQEMVRQDLTEKAAEVKGMSSTSQQDKARALWVRRWLLLSYTRSDPHTVPRQGLYHSYTLSCKEYGIKPINSASFGKAVRNAYPGIKTRRLGVRGNSKYHYVSIRPAIQIEAERLNEYGDSSGAWHVAPEDGSMDFQASAYRNDAAMECEDMDEGSDEEDEPVTNSRSPSSMDVRSARSSMSRDRSTSVDESFPQRPRGAFLRRHTTASLSVSSHQPFGESSQNPVFTLPTFPTLAMAAEHGAEIPMEQLQGFWNSFCQHQEILVECVRGYHFDRYEMNCRTFWQSLPPASLQVCFHPVVSAIISDAMAATFDHIVGTLLDKLLSPLPVPTQCSLRALADNLETIMEDSLSAFSRDFCEGKIELCARAAHLFIRFIDLHQLTAALSPILSNQSQVRTMLGAWETLDIRNVSDQCALSCSCQQDILESVLADFHQWLLETEAASARGGRAIERLGGWVNKVLGDVQSNVPGLSLSAIVCRVGFITSQVMRDFTLKSDQSFGLFQLVKTWVDDWVSIAALRKTKLSTTSVEAANAVAAASAAGSGAPAMSVYIPHHGQVANPDLSTAVPSFAQGAAAAQGLHPGMGGAGGFGGQGQGQYLPVPNFGGENNVVTPRHMFAAAHFQ
ncbi:hypothetical protein IAT38_001295 [Cryptococcus sp. DSM 104549]